MRRARLRRCRRRHGQRVPLGHPERAGAASLGGRGDGTHPGPPGDPRERGRQDPRDEARVPARFAPPGALSHPEEAVGRAPASAIALGSYVLASQLKDAGSGREPRSGRARIGAGRKPVQITVTGAEALGASGADPVGARVDVVVTTEPGPGGGSGRTYVAAREVRLLALSQGADSSVNDYSPSDDDQWTATLALTKPQALRLIQAESFARGVRLIAH
jgi:Flp pilus assembly protein CpaB